MYYLKSVKKVLAFISCAAISLGAVAAFPQISGNNADTYARSIQEIEAQRKANNEKIADLEYKITNLQGDIDYEEQQQAYLEEQIAIIQDNIKLLNDELEAIGNDIEATANNITCLDYDIANQQTAIDNNIELFKQRLCSMYISGSDTSASIVLGASSFYDMMSRVQVINRIAEYDDKLINDILAEIDSLEQSKSDLETEKLNLTMKLDEQNKRKEEKTAEIENYSAKMAETKAEIDRIAMEKESLARDKQILAEENAALDQEEADIYAAIQRAAEEAQRKAEEAAALAAAQAAAAAAAANNGGGGDTYTPAPAVQAPVYVQPSASGFSWPAPGFSYISSPFGPRWGRNHNGIDVGDGGIMGGCATASMSGTVITVVNSCSHNYAKNYSCGCGGGYGNYVVISHDGTYSTVYAHLTSACVSVGDYVSQGQTIGYIGCTGHSTGAHLHFEIRVNGSPQNPLNYVSP